MQINLALELEEVNGLLNLIGQLPTNTNVWPVANKIRSMTAAQLPKPEEGIENAVAKSSSTD
jgi:hypothetical protein